MVKAIRNNQDYKQAFKTLEELVDRDPDPDSDAGNQLSVLATLIEEYERRAFPASIPDALSAIQFCMDQLDLKAVDLVPYIGSASRVSEILSGKRQLTKAMVSALSTNLGIPAEVLLKPPTQLDHITNNISKSLVNTITARGYLDDLDNGLTIHQKLKTFFEPCLDLQGSMPRKANYRSPKPDEYAFLAWSAGVLNIAEKQPKTPEYKKNTVTKNFIKDIVGLSSEATGPLLARDKLRELGIPLVIQQHFPKTYLDGAVLNRGNRQPVIGMTLRLDRLDNFWFTLTHELAHIALHFDKTGENFFDELRKVKGSSLSGQEQEADDLARESLIPQQSWEVSPVQHMPVASAAQSLADDLGIDVSIVVGRVQHEENKWSLLNDIIKDKKVRHLFPEHQGCKR